MTAGRPRPKIVSVCVLGTTQTLAWASSYYLLAILADPIARELGIPSSLLFGLFSGALLITALLGPVVGRAIDRRGGRGVLASSNLVFAAGLGLLAASSGLPGVAAALALIGIGMALGLYDAAFATLTRLFGTQARGAITGITLFAGFASTVGWPLTAFVEGHFGWRTACVVWALLHLGLGLPLNRFALPKARSAETTVETPRRVRLDDTPEAVRTMRLLAFVFAAAWFVTGAMGAHLPRLLQEAGASPSEAVAAAALFGPAQVAARLVEFGVLRNTHPLVSARFATLMHPLGACVLGLLGASAAAAFALLHGAGNGLITIAKGTLPLALFGPANYGLRSGLLGAPARAAQAAAPLVFGLLLDRTGVTGAIAVSGGLSLAAFVALLAVRPMPRHLHQPG